MKQNGGAAAVDGRTPTEDHLTINLGEAGWLAPPAGRRTVEKWKEGGGNGRLDVCSGDGAAAAGAATLDVRNKASERNT